MGFGRRDDAARSSWRLPGAAACEEGLSGETVAGVGRRGKYVVFALASGKRLAVHLRMAGRLIVQAAGYSEPYPYTHVQIGFSDGSAPQLRGGPAIRPDAAAGGRRPMGRGRRDRATF